MRLKADTEAEEQVLTEAGTQRGTQRNTEGTKETKHYIKLEPQRNQNGNQKITITRNPKFRSNTNAPNMTTLQ